jgi:hypothetical protein
MNINLIYEENKFQFDIPQEVTIEYIKGLSSNIFGKGSFMDLYYHGKNLTTLSDNTLLKDIIEEDDDNIIINVQKKKIQHKRTNSFPNVNHNSTNNSLNLNNNEYIFQLLKIKFSRFENHYSNTIKEISLFEENLEENLNKLKKIYNEYKKTIKIISQKLSKFYNNSAYESLKEKIEKNIDSKLIKEDELNDIAEQIEKCIFNYKFLQTQYNFQQNIISYINLKIEELLNFKNNLNELEEKEEFHDIVNQLELIFNEINNNVPLFKPINLISSLFNIKYESINIDYSFSLKDLKNAIENKRNIENETKTLVKNDDNQNDKKIFNLKSKNNNKPFNNFTISHIKNNESRNLNNLDLLPSFASKSLNNRLINDKEKNLSKFHSVQTLPNRSLSPKLDLINVKSNYFTKPKIIEKDNQNLKKNYKYKNEENKTDEEKKNSIFQRGTSKKKTMANIILEQKNKEIELEVQSHKNEQKNESSSDTIEKNKDKEKEKEKEKNNEKNKGKIKEKNKDIDKNKNNNITKEKSKEKNKENNDKNQTTNEKNLMNLIQEEENKNKKKVNHYIKDSNSEKIDLNSRKSEKKKKKDENILSLNKDINKLKKIEKKIDKEEEDLNQLNNPLKNVIKITKNNKVKNEKEEENQLIENEKIKENKKIKKKKIQKLKEDLEINKEKEKKLKDKRNNIEKDKENKTEEKKEDKVKLGFHRIKTSPIPENIINLPNYESVNDDKKSFKSKDFTKENVEKLKEELFSPKKNQNNTSNFFNDNNKNNKTNNINDSNKELISMINSIPNVTNINEKSFGKESNYNESFIEVNNVQNEHLGKIKKKKKSHNKFDFII